MITDIKQKTQTKIRVVTIERPTMWIVVAVLVEMKDGRSVIISEPRIVKIIPKETVAPALGAGILSKKQSVLLLSVSKRSETGEPVIQSPYFNPFSLKQADFVIWFSARPPTFA